MITPAVSGPYDLGNVVVRAALHVDPLDAHVTAVSDPLPQILEGIPLRLRTIRVNLDRPDFTLNPTNCDPFAVDARDRRRPGRRGRPQPPLPGRQLRRPRPSGRSSPEAHAAASSAGATRRSTRSSPPQPGEANIASVSVALPAGELLDNSTSGTVCTRVGLRQPTPARPARVLGQAEARHPLLDQPLTGTVYLGIVAATGCPTSSLELTGPGRHRPAGKIDSVNGRCARPSRPSPTSPSRSFNLEPRGRHKGPAPEQRRASAALETATVEDDRPERRARANQKVAACRPPAAKRHRTQATPAPREGGAVGDEDQEKSQGRLDGDSGSAALRGAAARSAPRAAPAFAASAAAQLRLADTGFSTPRPSPSAPTTRSGSATRQEQRRSPNTTPIPRRRNSAQQTAAASVGRWLPGTRHRRSAPRTTSSTRRRLRGSCRHRPHPIFDNFDNLCSTSLRHSPTAPSADLDAVDNAPTSDSYGSYYLYQGKHQSPLQAYDGYGNPVNFTGSATYISGNQITGTPNGPIPATRRQLLPRWFAESRSTPTATSGSIDAEAARSTSSTPTGIFIRRITLKLRRPGARNPAGARRLRRLPGLGGIAVDPTNGDILVSDAAPGRRRVLSRRANTSAS